MAHPHAIRKCLSNRIFPSLGAVVWRGRAKKNIYIYDVFLSRTSVANVKQFGLEIWRGKKTRKFGNKNWHWSRNDDANRESSEEAIISQAKLSLVSNVFFSFWLRQLSYATAATDGGFIINGYWFASEVNARSICMGEVISWVVTVKVRAFVSSWSLV